MDVKSAFRRWVLPLSLALNVFLATIVVMHPPHHRPGPAPPAMVAAHIAETLPPADGAILLEVFTTHAAAFERSHQLRHSIPARVRAALASPRLDLDALRAVFDENRNASLMMDDALAATLMETASRISDEGRTRLARWEPPRPPGAPPGPRP
ncbi:MAG: periplasmic heavy metal sensor [Phaeospirillum sp.]|nr:periplasmic heavy metal sensor [Phaeospirillum sp.]